MDEIMDARQTVSDGVASETLVHLVAAYNLAGDDVRLMLVRVIRFQYAAEFN
jgi:hypothetical protein